MRNTMLAAASALMLGLASAGCASTPAADRADAPTLIEVENYNPLAVRVDVVSSGEDYRLGLVETTNTETFAMPRTVTFDDIRILVDPVGSTESYLSEELLVTPGDLIDVNVEADLDLTTVTVR